MTDTAKLRELAQAAMPNPLGNMATRQQISEHMVAASKAWLEFNSQATPATVLALLDELDRLRTIADHWRAECEKMRQIVEDARDMGDSTGIERDVYVWNKAIDYCLNRMTPASPPVQADIESAAMELAECMGYPWDLTTERERENMRKNARSIINAAMLSAAPKPADK